MLDITITRDASEGDRYMAEAIEPFGAGCVVLRGAWSMDWNGQRQESHADARTIILPAPTGRRDRIEVRDIGQAPPE